MKRRLIACAGVIVVVAMAVVAFRTIAHASRQAHIVRYDSSIQTLRSDTAMALDLYHDRHGAYPGNLDDLVYADHGDEFCPSMLKDLIYAAAGSNCYLAVGTNRLGFADYMVWKKTRHRGP